MLHYIAKSQKHRKSLLEQTQATIARNFEIKKMLYYRVYVRGAGIVAQAKTRESDSLLG
jgi:hypothetical protein